VEFDFHLEGHYNNLIYLFKTEDAVVRYLRCHLRKQFGDKSLTVTSVENVKSLSDSIRIKGCGNWKKMFNYLASVGSSECKTIEILSRKVLELSIESCWSIKNPQCNTIRWVVEPAKIQQTKPSPINSDG
jgi:hypothetical protein